MDRMALRRPALWPIVHRNIYCAAQHRPAVLAVLPPTLGVSSLTWAALRGGPFFVSQKHGQHGPDRPQATPRFTRYSDTDFYEEHASSRGLSGWRDERRQPA